MPCCKRLYEVGDVLHITHRCHKKDFLLKFKQDRDRYRYWLFEARKRYGFCVLNYIITSNHVHIMVRYTTKEVLSRSMQLIAGRTAQEFNIRKKRKGAFWEDRYHVSIIDVEEYMYRCFIYIDLNMVRAERVGHPLEWEHCGYYELFQGRERYQVLAHSEMLALLGYSTLDDLKENHSLLINQILNKGNLVREPIWTENRIISSFLLSK